MTDLASQGNSVSEVKMVYKERDLTGDYDDQNKHIIYAHEKQEGLIREDLNQADPEEGDQVYMAYHSMVSEVSAVQE